MDLTAKQISGEKDLKLFLKLLTFSFNLKSTKVNTKITNGTSVGKDEDQDINALKGGWKGNGKGKGGKGDGRG